MAFPMPKLKRLKSGAFSSRKVIPPDVREEYRARFGGGWEERFYAPSSTPLGDAKKQLNEWLAEIERRISAIRDEAAGKGRSLTAREALALAGEWYRWFVARYEDDPGDPEGWEELLHEAQLTLLECAPEWFRKNESRDREWRWAEDEAVTVHMRPFIADNGKTAQFLASRGLALTLEARERFLDAVADEFGHALKLLITRAEGDYSPDTRPQRFPKFAPATLASSAGPSCFELFQAWIKASERGNSTINRWRAVFLDQQSHFADRSAGSITEDEARAWKDRLITPERSAGTVRDIWVNAARTVFNWAVKERLVQSNPFAQVTVEVPKKKRLRETDAFTQDEARTILKAALAITDTNRPFAAACRWVPWICAYTGARAGEITQLRGIDVMQRDEVHALRLTPDAGTIKTGATRMVPIHEHLLAQGLLEFVRSRGDGALFYNPARASKGDADPTNPRRPRAVKTRERLAVWVRRIGIKDRDVRPNHAWRHTFKQVADRHDISERVSDEITGHAPLTVGRGYGRPMLADMAAALKKFPRYEVHLDEAASLAQSHRVQPSFVSTSPHSEQRNLPGRSFSET
jgi:integrase